MLDSANVSSSPSADLVRATWNAPLPPSPPCPARADVVIVGGGIVGVSTAWFLARAGVDVALCEKGHIAGEQSGRNWGWVRVQGRDPREVPMMLDSLRLWPTLATELGENVGFAAGGCLYAARDERQLAGYETWLPTAREYGIDSRIVTQQELHALAGPAAAQWKGALYTPTDGRAEPHLAAPAIARAAARAGAKIMTACAVRGMQTTAGRVSSVVTEAGEIQTSTVLCAAGAWSSLFCGSLGIRLPQLKVRGIVARTAPLDAPLVGNLFDDKIGLRRRLDGGYTVAHGSILDHGITPSTLRYSFKFLPALKRELGTLRVRFGKDFFEEWQTPSRWALDKPSPFEACRVLDPPVSCRVLAKVKKNLAATFPDFRDVDIVEAWAGMVETTPDVVPVIGAVDEVPGLFLATGFSGHGFGLGPGAAETIATLLTGGQPRHDLAPFRLTRFFDGTPIRPQATF